MFNVNGNQNTAVGVGALQENHSDNNTAVGMRTLRDNSTGSSNASLWFRALQQDTTGAGNTAIGSDALWKNLSGSLNVAVGIGALSNSSGGRNVAIGPAAGIALTTGDENVAIANPGVAGESATIRIGQSGVHTSAYIAGVVTSTIGSGTPVVVDTNGKLGVSVGGAGISGYQLWTERWPVAPNTVATVSASCPAGKKILGGGHRLIGTVGALEAVDSYPATDTRWDLRVRNNTAGALAAQLSLTCASVN
jgi:hypothetical protein